MDSFNDVEEFLNKKKVNDWTHTIQNGYTVVWLLFQTRERYTDPKHPQQEYLRCETRYFASQQMKVEGKSQPTGGWIKLPRTVIASIVSARNQGRIKDSEFGMVVKRYSKGTRLFYVTSFTNSEDSVKIAYSDLMDGKYDELFNVLKGKKIKGFG